MAYINRLKTFFMQNDPDRLYLAKKISRSFRHDEDAVMKRLEEIYATGGPKNLSIKELTSASKTKSIASSSIVDADNVSAVESSDDIPVKKKGKLKKIIILIVVIAALGGGGYFAFNMFMAGDHDESHKEETHSEGEHNSSSDHSEEAHSDHSPAEHSVSEESIIDEIESKMDEAEKDSTIEDIKDAAEALHAIGL